MNKWFSKFKAPERGGKPSLRAIALIAAYNEARFLPAVLAHLRKQGLEAVLFDNDSTDDTLRRVRPFLGRGLLSIERIPRQGRFVWEEILRRKAAAQDRLDADWFLHMDPDEFRFPPSGHATLLDWFADADRRGYNALNFQEYTFLPTEESPDHDHRRFQKTLRWYYPFRLGELHRVNAWKRQPNGVNLHDRGGHFVHFPGQSIAPDTGILRHYLFLSPAHAREKYGGRAYDKQETERGWHGWRGQIDTRTPISLPSCATMNLWKPGQPLVNEKARTVHHPFLVETGASS